MIRGVSSGCGWAKMEGLSWNSRKALKERTKAQRLAWGMLARFPIQIL